MRIFITGASGFIGNAAAKAFRRAGHHVKGLIRSETHARHLAKEEIEPVIGDIGVPESYLLEAANAEVLIHCALEESSEGVKKDLMAIDSFLKIASASDTPKAFLYTSGCWVYGNSPNVLDEDTPVNPLKISAWRPLHDAKVLSSASPLLRTVVLRPGCVYGGSGSLTADWFASAQKGSVEIVGNGKNYWAMVHKDDLAEAYVLAAEKELSGTLLNFADSTRYTVRQMAEAVAKVSGIPGKITHLTSEEAEKIHGSLASGLIADQKLSSERAFRLLGWRPRHEGFIEEIDLYYSAWKAQ